jgi:H+/Cl- antiporter ClcA
MDPFRTGKLVLFTVSYDRDWHYFEIPAYLLIGLFGVSSLSISWAARYRDLCVSIVRNEAIGQDHTHLARALASASPIAIAN